MDAHFPRPHVRDADSQDADALADLWHCCGLTRPWNDPYRDIERALNASSSRILVASTGAGARIVASAMVGYDGHRGWLYYLAVAPEQRRQGIAQALVETAERWLVDLGCPKLMMMVRTGQPELEAYYAARDYVANDVRCLGKRLIPDDNQPHR